LAQYVHRKIAGTVEAKPKPAIQRYVQRYTEVTWGRGSDAKPKHESKQTGTGNRENPTEAMSSSEHGEGKSR
jgi:hypothetical protein